MKNLFILAIVLLPQFAYSQIDIKEKKENTKIGEIKMAGMWMMSLEMDEDSSYLFLFRNLKYQSIIDVKSFRIDGSDIDTFYSTIINNLDIVEKTEFEMNLANGDILTMTFAKKKISFTIWNGSYLSYTQYFNRKQIDKLFGKN